MGMSFFQIAQFVREQATRVLVVGPTKFEEAPPLFEDKQFSPKLFSEERRAKLLNLTFSDPAMTALLARGVDPIEAARQAVLEGQYDAVLYFPPDFADKLAAFRASVLSSSPDPSEKIKTDAKDQPKVPSPQVVFNMAREKSQIAETRLSNVLRAWREAIGEKNLGDRHLPSLAARPFEIQPTDVADREAKKAIIWAKVLPFVLLLWALTGAFYPAVDLCAGEKERGTLETLLSSPAERIEIVWGKLLTVMLFSVATALLNLLSMGLTGSLVLSQFPEFGPPPVGALAWLVVALLPVSALFSALCLAIAAFARSTKEGQYYLMPLVLVTMPLTIMPMSPSVELDFSTSLIPISGVVLILRTVLEGNTAAAIPYLPVVMIITVGCSLLAVRWAADQFNKESVLFRESERLDVGLWLKHLMRDRAETPNVAAGVFCAVMILMLRFFMNFALKNSQNLGEQIAVSQLVVIATPALLMTVMLTRSPAKTLLLKIPSLAAIPAAVLLAILLHPLAGWLQVVIQQLYPVSDEIAAQFKGLFDGVSFWQKLILLALVPAICEELAFRGFILSGLRHLGHKWRAIVISSLFFGVIHGVLQQSISASLLGAVLGYLAVQTGSIFPSMLFHFTNNALLVIFSEYAVGWAESYPRFGLLLRQVDANSYLFDWQTTLVATLMAIVLFVWFHRLPYARSAEESLQETIEQNAAEAASA
jgi:sodium transport system permease protein